MCDDNVNRKKISVAFQFGKKAFMRLPQGGRIALFLVLTGVVLLSALKVRNYFTVKLTIVSLLADSSPLAELATRKICWQVVHSGLGHTKDEVIQRVYVIKVGFDFKELDADDIVFSKEKRAILLHLPEPKVISVDDFMTNDY